MGTDEVRAAQIVDAPARHVADDTESQNWSGLSESRQQLRTWGRSGPVRTERGDRIGEQQAQDMVQSRG
jgi:hypothetical protein